jgi:DNA-directed RNA polymerase specialized sigma24 family protein
MQRLTKAELAEGGADDAGDLLSYDEARAAFGALSEDDLYRLERGARHLAAGTGFESLDLLAEAIVRTLDGVRNYPRNVGLVPYLFMVMKGISSHDRKKQARLDQLGNEDEADAGVVDPAEDPEKTLLKKMEDAAFQRTYDEIKAVFDGDDDALLALAGLEEGLKGAELRDSLGITQTEYDYLLRRIRKKVEKMRPKEWRR